MLKQVIHLLLNAFCMDYAQSHLQDQMILTPLMFIWLFCLIRKLLRDFYNHLFVF